MTEKLYYKDSYIYEFEAKVLSCTLNNDLYDIVLDKTAFFPEGGGQYADKGFIDEAEIIDVQITDETIHHFSKSKIDTNKTVKCKVTIKDFESGEELFSGSCETKANSNSEITKIPVMYSDKKLLIFEWESEIYNGKNHYITGYPGFSFEKYKNEWLPMIKSI